MVDDIFAKIVSKEIPANIRYEDEDFLAFDDIHPRAPIHILLIPKAPYATLEDVPISDVNFHQKFLLIARKIAQQLGISKNYKLHMNVGQEVQAVPHVHLHIFGGWENPGPHVQAEA